MKIERHEHRHLDLICELDEPGTATRFEEWVSTKEQAYRTEKISQGVRIFLPVEAAEMARDLARREARCCGFLDISVATNDNGVSMDITSAAPVDVPLITFLRS